MSPPPHEDPRLPAAVSLLGRTGSLSFVLRYDSPDDSEGPVVWLACAQYPSGWEVAASTDPVTAVMRLCELIVDGGLCARCGRPTAFVPETVGVAGEVLASPGVCTFVFDVERAEYVRECERAAE